MKYIDSRGRERQLTPTQVTYLATAASRGGFDCGWGGLGSTLTVRLLEERGLIHLQRGVPGLWPRWRVTALTNLGQTVLAQWDQRPAVAV